MKWIWSTATDQGAAMAEEIFEFVLWLVVNVLFLWTGEIVLFVVSGGRHKPRWDLYSWRDSITFEVLRKLSFWLGFSFWVLVGYILLAF